MSFLSRYLPLILKPNAAAPPSFRAAGSYAEVASGGATLNPSMPTNLAGDLFLAVGVGYLSNITPPAGWSQQELLAGSNQQFYIWTRDTRSSGSESTAPGFDVDDRGAVRLYTFSGVKTTVFYTGQATAASLSGAQTTPTMTINSDELTLVAASGFSTAGSVSVGGSPSGGSWSTTTQAFGSSDIFFHHLQTASGSPGTISGGTITPGGVNSWSYIGFRLKGI